MTTDWSRREFLKTSAVVGVGLTLRFTIPGGVDEAGAAASFEPNAALTITPDGIITVHITKAEMGQGVGTALAQIAAEELGRTGRTSASTTRSTTRSTGSC